MIKIVNLNNEQYDIYIGRGSKWDNPFKIGKDGTRLEVIKKYEKWIMTQPKLLNSIHELDNKILGCYCYPNKCHGDILKKIAIFQKFVTL